MRCPNCHCENPGSKKFCSECGARLLRRCPQCGADNAPAAKFCGECGAALADKVQTDPAKSSIAASPIIPITAERTDAASALEGERKTVTALFADIKGSTELMRDLDPEEARAIIDPALRLMIDAVHRYDGYVVQSTGDGIFALFGAPVAHEDHPQRALHAALATRDELRRRADDDLRRKGRAGVEVRIGINTGEVVMRMVQTGGHTEYSPVGHAINLAQRMESVAPPDCIVVSEATQRLVEGYFELRGMGPTEIKGIAEPINVYEVLGVGALHGHFDLAARRGLTRFVGREAELAQMRNALDLAISGHGQIVAVMAEAGTGKSRLFHEFKATIPTSCKVLEAYSVSHGKASAWLPVLELLRDYFGIEDADDAASRREKVRTMLSALDPSLGDTAAYLFGLFGILEGLDPLAQMAPPIKLQRTLDAIKRIILGESLKQPVVVIFEDLHWIDVQTQALLDMLADSIGSAHVLLLVNYRPEYQHEWAGKSYYSRFRLDPLGGADGAAMLTDLLGEGVELNPLKRMITERTGGNPFFIEEIVQALFDEGTLMRNGTVKVTSSLSQLRLPATVQGILAARIDRQPDDHKQLLQTLSVIGRESSFDLVKQMVAGTGVPVKRLLAELQTAEFIYEQPAIGAAEYVFKHALTQEVAYNSLLIERRKQLHEQTGQTLEILFASKLDDHLTQLAHHYSHSANAAKAVEYLGRAGQQAMQRSAHADAVSNLTSAIDLLQNFSDSPERLQRELPLQLYLGQAFIVSRGWSAQEVERAFTRAQRICADLNNPPEIFSVLMGLWAMYHVRGLYGPARERAYQVLRLAQNAGIPTMMVLAHYAVGLTSMHTGELLIAREHQDRLLSLYDQERDGPLAFQVGTDLKQGILSYLGWTLWYLGYPDQAVKRSNEAVAAARAVHHVNSIGSAEFFSIIVHNLRRELSIVQENTERVFAFAVEHGLGAWLLMLPLQRGWVMDQLGRHEEGVALIEDALARAHVAGADIGRSNQLRWLADGYGKIGRIEEALTTIAEALTSGEEQEERLYASEIYQSKGELLLKQSPSNAEEARGCFERAIEIARTQSAKSLELRATTSLAGLLVTQGRGPEARTMLGEIYNWFTEGFDTADLIDAKALLDELGN